MLTGVCKEAFEKWYNTLDISVEISIAVFQMGLPFSFRYGVYLDFFDENGLFINIESESVTESPYWSFTIDYNMEGHEGNDLEYLTRQEAQIESIKKANEIYNNKFKTQSK